jgi:hypothetical protein
MRTKTLLLTAALTAAGVAASMAQVYSVNVVGYVNITVPAGKLAILCNPLDDKNGNKLNNLLALADTADGARIFRFDADKQTYRNTIQFYPSDPGPPALPAIWDSFDDHDPAIQPGEGFWIKAPAAHDLNITWVGEVMQGALPPVSIKGGGHLTLVGSQVPQQNYLGDPSQAGTMNFAAADSDVVYVWDMVNQKYMNSSIWFPADNSDPGNPLPAGWVTFGSTDIRGPQLDVGQGFWVKKAAANPDANWTRTFNVQ